MSVAFLRARRLLTAPAIALVAGDIDAALDEANDAGFDSSDTQLILDRY
ncbi:hypothetical protein [Streptomyces lannensis]|uniref:Uncharacterized protein n=1 Tax=Streptomyces lannensis TaxID=766498 RepID=A0ABP7KMM6_9ACTN